MIHAWLFLLPFRLFKPGHILVLAREETLLTDIFHMLIVLEMKYFFFLSNLQFPIMVDPVF